MNTIGLQGSIPIVLAVQNEAVRKRLVSLAQQTGYDVEQVGPPNILWQLTREQYSKSWVILDTEDDIAWLVQLVNDYHRSPFHIGGSAPIICLASEQAITTNGRLGFWLIDGGAAVSAVWIREGDFSRDLLGLNRSLRQEQPRDIKPERPSWDDLVTQVLQAPGEGQRMLDFGVRLTAWQDSPQTRHEVARAFLRQAMMQMPDSAEAHRCYGKSLFRTHRDEGLFHLREAVRLAPEDAEGYLALGRSLVEVDRAEAMEALLKAMQLDPDGNFGRQARYVISSRRLDGE